MGPNFIKEKCLALFEKIILGEKFCPPPLGKKKKNLKNSSPPPVKKKKGKKLKTKSQNFLWEKFPLM